MGKGRRNRAGRTPRAQRRHDEQQMAAERAARAQHAKPAPEMASKEKLARALEEAGDPKLAGMIKRARAGYYSAYESPLDAPETTLLVDLKAAGHEALAERALAGEFEATKAESEAWAESPEGQSVFTELLGFGGLTGGRELPSVSTPDEDNFWVESDLASDGFYVATARYGDHIRPLNVTEALEFAEAMLAHYSRADYDAAVLNQMTVKMEIPEDVAAEVVQGLRKGRPPIDDARTAPITVVEGVAKDEGAKLPYRPFLQLRGPNGKLSGQLDMDGAAQIIRHMLEVTEGANLDAAYFRHLTGVIGVDDKDRCRAMIGDLWNWRHHAQ